MSLGRWLLPRRGGARRRDYLRLDRYYTELVIEPESPWIGKPLRRFEKAFKERLHRGLAAHGAPARSSRREAVQAGDVLLVRASPDEIASIKDEPGLALHAIAKYGEQSSEDRQTELRGEEQLVQVVVAPHSRFVGRTSADIDFLRNLGVVVVGLWRREGWLREEMSQMRLHEGDLLVLWGRSRTFEELAAHRGFLMMVPFAARSPTSRNRAALALAIVAAVIVAAATGCCPRSSPFSPARSRWS